MADQELRELARVWGERRELEVGRRLLLAQLRAGLLDSERRDLAVWLGPDERAALDPGRRLPERLFQPGVQVSLATVRAGRGDRLAATARTADGGLERLVVALAGSIRSREQPAFLALVEELLSFAPGRLVLDLSEVRSAHSYAMSGLVGLAGRLADEGGRLAVACPPDRPLAVVIPMFGLAEALRLCDDVEQALTAPIPGPSLPASRRRPPSSDLVRWVLRLARWGEEPCRALAVSLGWTEQVRHLDERGCWETDGLAKLLVRVGPEPIRAALIPYLLG